MDYAHYTRDDLIIQLGALEEVIKSLASQVKSRDELILRIDDGSTNNYDYDNMTILELIIALKRQSKENHNLRQEINNLREEKPSFWQQCLSRCMY